MSRTRTALRLALGAGLGVLALAAPASAATITVEQHEGNACLRFAAAAGEANKLRVSTASDGRIAFKDDGAGVSESSGACSRLSDHEVRCRATAAPTLAVSLGDRDDQLVGERILRAAPALASVARLVRSSHERFDGSGYPDRLAGEAIPLGARIVAACDAWDAMITTRPYRRALSRSAALKELQRCSGTQFDPDVVRAVCEEVRTTPRRRETAAAAALR